MDVLQQLINGLSLGALYALIAVGYTVVYGIVQLINFAHGEIFMMGAFGSLTVWLVLGRESGSTGLWLLPLMLIGGVAVAVGVALLTERFAYRPLRNAPRRIRFSVISPKNRSTRFSHDALVGVK